MLAFVSLVLLEICVFEEFYNNLLPSWNSCQLSIEYVLRDCINVGVYCCGVFAVVLYE